MLSTDYLGQSKASQDYCWLAWAGDVFAFAHIGVHRVVSLLVIFACSLSIDLTGER